LSKEIPLTHNTIALVDDEDEFRILERKWRLIKRRSLDKTGYAVSSRSPHIIRMHRFLINAPEDFEVDHINGNTLDNRKENLRLATRSENAANRKAKGFYKYGSKYRAFCGGRALGYFLTEEEARDVYEKARKERYGEFG
jgi:hypothetical protein